MNILFLTHRLPYAPNRGDRIRAYHLLEHMSTFANVALFSLVHDEHEAARTDDMPFATSVTTVRARRLGNVVRGAIRLPSANPSTHSLLDAPGATAALSSVVDAHRPDLIVAYCSGMARFALEPPLDTLPCVLDMVDVDSAKWRELANQTPPPRRWLYQREARTLARFEARAAEQAGAVLVVTAREAETLRALAPAANIHVMQNGVDVATFAPSGPPAAAPAVVFTGVMSYEPNVEAVCWFTEQVWPLVRRSVADATFTIVGSNPASAVSALGRRDSSVTVTGRVDAVEPYLWEAAVSVAPLQVARGLQNKVLEALAAGVPAVVTPAVSAGLPPGVSRGCRVAETPADFAAAVVDLLRQAPDARRAVADAADVASLTWRSQFAPLAALLGRVASHSENSRPSNSESSDVKARMIDTR